MSSHLGATEKLDEGEPVKLGLPGTCKVNENSPWKIIISSWASNYFSWSFQMLCLATKIGGTGREVNMKGNHYKQPIGSSEWKYYAKIGEKYYVHYTHRN